ncbi:hypothetical protein AB3662_40450 [Sorangium cellulosum]|uniref:hypothetical protein n=1 Tax=Sorangium cellulosum TaxID=56 RepID=UPI003D9A76DE
MIWSCDECPEGWTCTEDACIPPHCSNGVMDDHKGETDTDCGGSCAPCRLGAACETGLDCKEGVCRLGACQAPTCVDGVENGFETGVDCGTRSCPLCPAGEGCLAGENCASGVCRERVCQEPSCDDGTLNGSELDVDCGGACRTCK